MKKWPYLAVASTAALALLTACGAPGGAADSDGPIKIGVIADLTGATGDVGTPYNRGMLDYVAWRNKEGGIDGRKIEADSNDYAYKVPAAEELYKKYVSDGSVAIQGWGTSDSDALRTKVATDELPFMSGSLAEALTDPEQSPYNFVPASTYSDQMRVALDWINGDSGGKGNVAVLHIDAPAGLEPTEDGAEWVKEKGYDLTYKNYPMPAASSFVSLLLKAQKQGADYVVVQHVSSPAAQVAKDLAAQGLKMKIVCLSICADEFFVKTAGAAAEGAVMVTPVAPPTAEKPGHEEMRKFLEAKGGDLDAEGVHYVQGWYTMAVMSAGIEKTLADGDDLTGANIRAALESMPAVDTGGAMGEPKFSSDSHRGERQSGVYQVKSGVITELEAALTPQE
jgi:branched-chain amino acid transport system substrate-binding protein